VIKIIALIVNVNICFHLMRCWKLCATKLRSKEYLTDSPLYGDLLLPNILERGKGHFMSSHTWHV